MNKYFVKFTIDSEADKETIEKQIEQFGNISDVIVVKRQL